MDKKPGLFQLAMPLLLNSVMGLLTAFADALIISRHSSAAAAAVSLANQILMVAYDLSLLMAIGGAIVIAHSLGKKKPEQGRTIAHIAIVTNTLWGCVIGVVVFFFAPLWVVWIHAPAEVADATRRYIQIAAIAIPFNGFLMAAMASMRAFAQVKAIFMLGLVAFPCYLLLNFVLVLGLGEFQGLGVEGSALATLLVRLGSFFVLLLVLQKTLSLSWCALPPRRWLLSVSRRIVRFSGPSVLDNLAYGFYQLVLLSFVTGAGVMALVSRFYALSLSAFLSVVVMAISQANEVLAAYRFGARDWHSINALVWRSGLWSAVMATVLALCLYCVSTPLVRLFTDDAQAIALTGQLLWLTVFIQPLTGLNTVLFHSLRVVGDVRAPVIFSQWVMWGMAVPAAYVFCVVLQLGVVGLWYAMILEEAAKTVYMCLRWQGFSRLHATTAMPFADTAKKPLQ